MRKQIASITDQGQLAPSQYCLWLAVTLVLVSSVSFAQVERATITGTLTDKNGAVVPDAAVRVTEESTNETKVHLAASIPNFFIVQLPGSGAGTATPQGGFFPLPTGVCLGVEVDLHALERNQIV